ncbi:MAG: L,D-transpeptidase [Bdellovibrionota bacterium]
MKISKKINILTALLFCSCSIYTNGQGLNKLEASLPTYNKSGMIALSGSLPTFQSDVSPKIVAFLSTDNKIQGNWLLVDTKERTLEIKRGDATLETILLKGNIGVRPGIYSVFSKEEAPLWYASDSYYYNRNLVPPRRDSKSRYVKGALGNFAIFLNDNLAIHDSKINSFDVQGLRLGSNDIKKVYSMLESGALVRVY